MYTDAFRHTSLFIETISLNNESSWEEKNMSTSKNLSNISRRDLFKVAGRYGMSSTLLAAGSFGGAMSLANLASAAESTYESGSRSLPNTR